MKQILRKYIFVAAVIAGLTINSAFASNIAYVDVQKVVSSSSQVQALKKEQQTKVKEFMKSLEKARKEVAAVSDLKKKQALEDKYNKEFVNKKDKMESDYTAKLKIIEDSISNKIAEQAKAKGYDMVVSKGIVLYGGDDITEDVIKVVK